MVIIFLISSIFINWNFSVRKMCLFLSFIYLFNHLYQIRLMDIYFTFWVMMQYYHNLFYWSKCSSFGHWKLFYVGLVSFWHASILFPPFSSAGDFGVRSTATQPSEAPGRPFFLFSFFFLSISLLSGTTSASGSSCYFFWHRPSHSSREPWFLLLKTKI